MRVRNRPTDVETSTTWSGSGQAAANAPVIAMKPNSATAVPVTRRPPSRVRLCTRSPASTIGTAASARGNASLEIREAISLG